jgi:hypothetical protein
MEHIGTNKVKSVASQTPIINLDKNLRSKLLKCCANIYFNRQCLHKKIIPKYVNIKVANTSPAAQTTMKNVQLTRIKEEIRMLYKPSGCFLEVFIDVLVECIYFFLIWNTSGLIKLNYVTKSGRGRHITGVNITRCRNDSVCLLVN